MAGRIKAGEGTLIGNAGECYVAAELLKSGVIAALAPRNAHSLDILASRGCQTVRIRVKTKSAEYSDWQWMIKKDGSIFRNLSKESDFTVLVDLAMDTRDMKYYVIPTYVVNDLLVKDYKKWVATPGRNGRPHDASIRKRNLDSIKYAKRLAPYLNAWDILWATDKAKSRGFRSSE